MYDWKFLAKPMLDLTDRDELILYLKAHRLWLKKAIGQHFLIDRPALDQIVQVAELQPDDRVLEIGPGVGTLTQALASSVPDGLVLAVEKDFKLVTVLRDQFKNRKNVKIVHEDALRFLQEIERLDPSADEAGMSDRRLGWKFVANLPYNLTGQILRLLFEPTSHPPLLTLHVLMLQKEVVDRLLAPPGTSERGILTILRELYGPAQQVVTVPKTAFFPVPAVDSAVIHIDHYPPYPSIEARRIIWLAKCGFSAKRRTLENSLAGSLHQSKSQIASWLAAAKISTSARAEDLDLVAWQQLTTLLRPFLRSH